MGNANIAAFVGVWELEIETNESIFLVWREIQ